MDQAEEQGADILKTSRGHRDWCVRCCFPIHDALYTIVLPVSFVFQFYLLFSHSLFIYSA